MEQFFSILLYALSPPSPVERFALPNRSKKEKRRFLLMKKKKASINFRPAGSGLPYSTTEWASLRNGLFSIINIKYWTLWIDTSESRPGVLLTKRGKPPLLL